MDKLFDQTVDNFRHQFLKQSSEARDALRCIVAARDLSPDEPIPTPLMCAIEAARKVVA